MSAAVVDTGKGGGTALTDAVGPAPVGNSGDVDVCGLQEVGVGTTCRDIEVLVPERGTRVDTITECDEFVVVVNGERVGLRTDQRGLVRVHAQRAGVAALGDLELRPTLHKDLHLVVERSVLHAGILRVGGAPGIAVVRATHGEGLADVMSRLLAAEDDGECGESHEHIAGVKTLQIGVIVVVSARVLIEEIITQCGPGGGNHVVGQLACAIAGGSAAHLAVVVAVGDDLATLAHTEQAAHLVGRPIVDDGGGVAAGDVDQLAGTAHAADMVGGGGDAACCIAGVDDGGVASVAVGAAHNAAHVTGLGGDGGVHEAVRHRTGHQVAHYAAHVGVTLNVGVHQTQVLHRGAIGQRTEQTRASGAGGRVLVVEAGDDVVAAVELAVERSRR